MAVKMLTTKKHSKTAKLIQKSKEDNKPIEVVKPIAKKVVKKPIAKIPKIGKREYNRALKIVNQYLKQNEN
jgi:hypothetical protein